MNLPYKAYAISEAGCINLATISPSENGAKANWLALCGLPPVTYSSNPAAVVSVFDKQVEQLAAITICVPVEVRLDDGQKPAGYYKPGETIYWLDEQGKQHSVVLGNDPSPVDAFDRLDGLDAKVNDLFRQLRDVRERTRLGGIEIAKRVTELCARLKEEEKEGQTRDMILEGLGRRVSALETAKEAPWSPGILRELSKRLDALEAEHKHGFQQDTGSERYRELVGEEPRPCSEGMHPETVMYTKAGFIPKPVVPCGNPTCSICGPDGTNPTPWPRGKSLGWINVYTVDPASTLSRGGPRINGPFATKAEANANAHGDHHPILTRAACVEIFEGDGL